MSRTQKHNRLARRHSLSSLVSLLSRQGASVADIPLMSREVSRLSQDLGMDPDALAGRSADAKP